MSENIVYIDRSDILDGKLEELREGINELVEFVDAHEPQVISYGFFKRGSCPDDCGCGSSRLRIPGVPHGDSGLYNVSGTITDVDRGDFLEGPASYWVDELTRLTVELGMDAFIFWPAAEPTVQLRRFAEEVAPDVRGVRHRTAGKP